MRAAIKQLEMRVRAASPQWLRRTYRALRPSAPASRDLPPELVKDCRFCASRVHLLYELPRDGVVAELGTYKGDFARDIVLRNNPRELHLVDIDYSHFDGGSLSGAGVTRHQGLAHEVIATFPDDHFDWIYIDADHSYEGVLGDARAAAPKIKPGGFMVFNDFAHIDPALGRYGVHRAVVDFAIEARWPFRYFGYQSSALYDVALGKPA